MATLQSCIEDDDVWQEGCSVAGGYSRSKSDVKLSPLSVLYIMYHVITIKYEISLLLEGDSVRSLLNLERR